MSRPVTVDATGSRPSAPVYGFFRRSKGLLAVEFPMATAAGIVKIVAHTGKRRPALRNGLGKRIPPAFPAQQAERSSRMRARAT
jgi:hypothetical protein